MSDKAFLDTNGLIHYNSNLMKFLNPSCEFKKGLISKSELPCYVSSYQEVYNKNSQVFYDYAGENGADFEFFKTNKENDIYDYTIIFDGVVYENVKLNYSSGTRTIYSLGQLDPADENTKLFYFQYSVDGNSTYSVFGTKDEDPYEWSDRTDEKRGEVIHNIQIYIKDTQHEYVRKLDSKYLNTSNGISESDSGLTSGSQVYTYVNNQVAVMQTVMDTVESVLATI
jgi:hypothetical protein